ncbi:3-oxoacyl-ACP synthase III family protein [Nocardiopsis sp. B62]|uniref:3-oxoacyl-ACP synthase III family protein n=1 Tax=Nocardiopsis sp. B62 TaxID=2824874 RepID=UPI001B37A538|nr:ketoacyl-ACP synthase III [Nocardiopsis sp. B62]MBQ1080555.1 ketoacyl-ACP synthase III [Nocardiopsis sp. B62]
MRPLQDVPSTSGSTLSNRFPVGILGVGSYVPDNVVTNEELTRHLDTSDEWIVARTGIRERRFLPEGTGTTDMCVAAAERALRESGTDASDLDCVIVATFTFDQLLPSTALTVAERIGARRAVALDLNQAACSGGLYGMWTALHLFQGGQFQRVLVVGAEALSRITDPTDRTTRVFFGDAAGAAVLGPVEESSGVLSWSLGGTLSHGVEVPAGGTREPFGPEVLGTGRQYLKMNGSEVWDQVMTRIPPSVEETLKLAGLRADEVDHYVFHQANGNLVTGLMDALGQPREKAVTTIEEYGNTGAATIFTVLDRLRESGRPRAGEHVLIAVIGAGFLWGSMCLRQQASAA